MLSTVFGPGYQIRLSFSIEPRPRRPCRKTGFGEIALTSQGITAVWPLASRGRDPDRCTLGVALSRRVFWRIDLTGLEQHHGYPCVFVCQPYHGSVVPRRCLSARSHRLLRSFLSPPQRIVAHAPWRNNLRLGWGDRQRVAPPTCILPRAGGRPVRKTTRKHRPARHRILMSEFQFDLT
jgi:hypothetical protein